MFPPDGVTSSVGDRPILIAECWKLGGIGYKRLEDTTKEDIIGAILSVGIGQVRPYGGPPLPPRSEKAHALQLGEREMGQYAIQSMPTTLVVETKTGQPYVVEMSGFAEGASPGEDSLQAGAKGRNGCGARCPLGRVERGLERAPADDQQHLEQD